MSVITWPIKVLRPSTANLQFRSRSLAASTAVSGLSQTVSSDAAIWAMSFDGFNLLGAEPIKAWRSIEGLLEGRINPINVPFYDYEGIFQPGGLLSSQERSPVPHSDNSFFSDGSGYSRASTLSVKASAAAPLRSVTITATVEYGDTIEPPAHFSIEHPTKGHHIYRVLSVVYSGDDVELKFTPVLREAVTSGTCLEFDRPICRMRLATDNEMDMTLQQGVLGVPSVNFVEDVF